MIESRLSMSRLRTVDPQFTLFIPERIPQLHDKSAVAVGGDIKSRRQAIDFQGKLASQNQKHHPKWLLQKAIPTNLVEMVDFSPQFQSQSRG
jgi:hypothetical protein